MLDNAALEVELIQGDEALMHYLQPLSTWLNASDISDIHINQPQEIFVVSTRGEKTKVSVPELTAHTIETLCKLIATNQNQLVSAEKPLLSASLPQGHRVQVVMPPVSATSVERAPILAFRKQVISDLTLDFLIEKGLFEVAKPHMVPFFKEEPRQLSEEEGVLSQLFADEQYADFLKMAIAMKKNILISGATGSGKTTLLNACLKEIPLTERIITLEDTRELHLNHPDHNHLLVSKGDQGISKVTMSHLVEVCLRLSPDRIIFGEMRGPEALDFMNASLTGHEGALVSLHAVNPSAVFLRLANMVQSNPHVQLSRKDILSDLHFLIDVVIQMKKVSTPSGEKRVVTEMYSAFNE
jgi:type IV secretion system protein VirB11